jgi:hypothetical protein
MIFNSMLWYMLTEYNRKYIYEPPEFADLAAILRASLALSFDSLSIFAQHSLQDMWPNTLPSTKVGIRGQPVNAEETIVLAYTCAQPKLFKRAFYELLRAPGLGQSADEEFILNGNDETRRRKKVSPADLARLIKTREELCSQWARGAALPPDPKEFPCSYNVTPLARTPEGEACAQATLASVQHWREAVFQSDIYSEFMNDPLAGLERLIAIPWEEKGFCKKCVNAWCTSWTRQREKIWANLDLWLDLPGDESKEKDET